MATQDNPQMNFSGLEKLKTYDDLFAEAQGAGVSGFAKNIQSYLTGLKKEVSSGNLSIMDFQNHLEELGQPVSDFFNELTTHGSRAADEAKTAASAFKSFIDLKTGVSAFDPQKDVKIPFTKSEYAALPENVLPTQKDVTSGKFDETRAPFKRYNTGAGATGDGGTYDPNLGKVVADPLGNTVVTDARQRQIEEEAARQAEQSKLMLEESKTARAKQLTDLSELLTKRSQETFNLEKPGMYEDLNTRGLLRSSALGDRLSTRSQELERENQNNIAQAALGYGDTNLAELQNILGTQQGFQTAGLQARLGLEDAEAQATLAKTLAELSQPKAASGKSSAEKWAQGIGVTADVIGAVKGK